MLFGVTVFTILSFCAFALRRTLRYLHILQQDDYIRNRFIGWVYKNLAFDRKVSAALGLLTIIWLFLRSDIETHWWILAAGVVFLLGAWFEKDPRNEAKKKLVVTKRARRIFVSSMGIVVLVAVLIAFVIPVWGWILVVQSIPICLYLGDLLLSPYEKKTQNQFRSEAVAKLKSVNPQVIAVTGSFGKTSVKHILGHSLSLNAKTLMTPGSVNTEMGVSRIIREQLNPGCQFFLTEMGAYGIGSIARLCRFTPPDIGIITAIGAAHYERFKSLEAVAKAKFELAEAVLAKPNGKMILHESVMQYCQEFEFINNARDRVFVCGDSPESEFAITRREQNIDGLSVDVKWQGNYYTLSAPLYGLHHADNMVVAFATAAIVGIDPNKIVASMRTAPQIQHRLEVKKQADGTVYIDDAYNSNPKGFKSALELLSKLAPSNNKRILVTPGVTELGASHDEAHLQLGAVASVNTDVVLVVNSSRIPTFMQGLASGEGSPEIHEVATFLDANAWIIENVSPGDVVLIENDLPDIFNRSLKL